MGGAIRVAIVDDHPLYRDGVVATFRSAADFRVVGVGGCAGDALSLVRDHNPDILLLDISIPGNGLAAIQALIQSQSAVKIVMLTVSEDEHHVSTAMKAGAAGYIVKGVTGRDLTRIAREIQQGARYVSPSLAASIMAQPKAAAAPSAALEGLSELTSREGQVVSHVARGLTNKEVARILTLSEKTVKHHMTSIMQKLQVRNRSEVVLIASGNSRRAHI